MKKLLLLLCLSIVSLTVNAQSTDLSLFGFKGKVTKAEIKRVDEFLGPTAKNYGFNIDIPGITDGLISFDKDGNIIGDYILWDGYKLLITKRTAKGFSGDDFNATVVNNRISKLIIKSTENGEPSTMTRTYTYDKNGVLTKVKEVYVYTAEKELEYGGGVYGVDDYNREMNKLQKEFERKLTKGMNYQKANKWFNDAEKRLKAKLNGVGVNAYVRTKKIKKTETTDYTYSNYVFDDFGNWISRKKSYDDIVYKENQNICYEPEFWSQFYWERIEKEGDLKQVEDFFNNSITTATYKNMASEYWNGHILGEIANKYNNNLDSLCIITKKPIISDAVKEQALQIVGEEMFNHDVMAERNYNQVAQLKDLTRQNVKVFNDYYQKKIDARSEQLRTDSIELLTKTTNQSFERKNYESAVKNSKLILLIDPNNGFAKDKIQESCYMMVLEKENNNNVAEKDYEDFLEQFSNSPHAVEMQNKRALYASSLFNSSTSNEELRRVVALPTDDDTHREVEKRYKRWMFKNNHGRFFHIGIGAEYAYGGTNSIAAGELAIRLGYLANLMNMTVGVKYNYLAYSSQMFKKPKEAGNAYFECQYLSIPVMLRFNIKHGYHGSTYIAAGAELDVTNVSASLRDVENVKEKKFATDEFRISPRVAFGGTILGVELELFANYDMKNPFNVDYIGNYKLSTGKLIETACKPDVYEKQMNADGFFDKLHFGLALRLWF